MCEAIKSAARPGGARSRRARSTIAIAEVAQVAKSLAEVLCILLQIFFGGVFYPPYNPPRRPAHPAGRAQKAHPGRLEIDQNFDHFSDSIFDRFWVVLGRQVGVVFGTFGAQVRSSCVQNASWKFINVKNVIFHETLRLPMFQRFLEPQDGLQNAPRSAQDGSKRLLKIIFWLLKIVLKFVSFWVSILVDFGLPNGAP